MSEINLTLAINNQSMMSSREISELTDKRHTDVIRDIWAMLESLYGLKRDDADLRHYKNQEVKVETGVTAIVDNRGYISEFLLDRRHTEILITGYDVKRRAAVIDRWFALESGNAQPKYPVPQSFSEALMLASELAKKNELLTDERNEAVRTKALISQKREATACQRNSVYQRIANKAIKDRDEMAALLGASKEYASVRSVWRATGTWYNYRSLVKWQDEHDAMESYYWDESTDARILCYPREAWLEVYGVDIAKLF
ncbi:Rha family transcriptional regulator [Erwinia tracheiphila]|uniref:Transcriptional regulator n=1 Tax=Erwinia tracheiphila TaxID=65700 RepID=A0A345CXI7_9GAMM|nr:Rha family transcriptional regulator [Erwinia tracheiphila]AXF78154.1 transcriptional regulator [Erwinia tracheiphila]UIA83127.1 Rha family transcriptional regulator [Erwinia tracheiphila]UIA91706.1 Rha family transcriptional regulator [Erwinia tracheiphila]